LQRRFDQYFKEMSNWGTPTSAFAAESGIRVITISALLKLALPPLFISSLPNHAIGFSFPRGREGRIIGIALLGLTIVIALSLSRVIGVYAYPLMIWLTGGTSIIMLYNCASNGMAFVKERCSACRLLPLIEEHEAVHLTGEPSEKAIWNIAKTRYSYEGLRLDDPGICSFCPIPHRLRADN
jgi:hypothetical protein